jgi:hypothetical protein
MTILGVDYGAATVCIHLTFLPDVLILRACQRTECLIFPLHGKLRPLVLPNSTLRREPPENPDVL